MLNNNNNNNNNKNNNSVLANRLAEKSARASPNDLFCVEWDVKPRLNQSINQRHKPVNSHNLPTKNNSQKKQCFLYSLKLLVANVPLQEQWLHHTCRPAGTKLPQLQMKVADQTPTGIQRIQICTPLIAE